MKVGEYNILDLVKDNKKKKHAFFVFFCTIIFEMQENVLFQPRCNLDFGH
jgi:hypothetical protein